MKIALLEDDPSQARLVERWLAQAGLDVVLFNSGAAFREGIEKATVDIIIIDWMLPDDDGLAVLVWLRDALQCRLPVMFATTRAEEASLVTALDKGADDYLIKPLRQQETPPPTFGVLRPRVSSVRLFPRALDHPRWGARVLARLGRLAVQRQVSQGPRRSPPAF